MSTHADRTPEGGVLQRSARAFRRLGPAGVAQAVFRAVRTRVFDRRRLQLFVVDVRQIRNVGPALQPGETFSARVIEPEVASGLVGPRDANVMRGHLDGALGMEVLLAGFIGDRLVAWNLVACPPVTSWPLGETGSSLTLAPTDAVFTSGYVLPEFRGRRAFQAMYTASASLAAERGARRLWSWCEEWNAPSRKAMLAVGFQPAGTHARWTLLGFRGPLAVSGDTTPDEAH